eukprot:gene20779-22807_t
MEDDVTELKEALQTATDIISHCTRQLDASSNVNEPKIPMRRPLPIGASASTPPVAARPMPARHSSSFEEVSSKDRAGRAEKTFREAFPALKSRKIKHAEQRQLLHSIIPFPLRETWTHDFCCLPEISQDSTPSAKQSEALNRAGLGKTKIKFENRNFNHAEVCDKLEAIFPQLKFAGGFTLHRAKAGGQNRQLHPLITEWYDIKSLKAEVSGSACLYIKPLQHDLDLSKPKEVPKIVSPMVVCLNCKQQVPICDFADHKQNCISKPAKRKSFEVITIDETKEKETGNTVETESLTTDFDPDIFFNDAKGRGIDRDVKGASANDDVDLDVLRQRRISFLEQQQSSPSISTAVGAGTEEQDEQNTEIENILPSEEEKVDLNVHRSTLRQDMIKLFMQDYYKKVNFIVYNGNGDVEPGVGDGVARDVYASFWKEVADSLLIGQAHRLPYVRHDLYVQEWEAVGRILHLAYSQYSYFPLILSSAFVCFILFDMVPQDILLESFYLYLAPDESDTLKQSIQDFDTCDEDELMDVLDRFKCRRQVKASNIKEIVLELATQELIQKPHLMTTAMRPSFLKLKEFKPFQNPENVREFYNSKSPTPQKVLNLIKASPQNDREREMISFLQRYIRGLDSSQLQKFLRFTTGADVISVEKIEVSFVFLEGLARRPVARTCTPLLELPNTYENFCQLREDFQNVLAAGDWQFDFV